jgi:NAD dependent epimerase/dehydratase
MKLTGKKVLVTGADGFIGSHLVEHLIEENCEITALAYYNSFNDWGWLDTIPKKSMEKISVVTGDVRDPNNMREIVNNIDVVFHLAALIAIPYSYIAPDSYVDTNIKGTLNVLQAAKTAECKKIIVTSTSEVYGTAKYIPIDESHPYQGQSPYSATKIGADRIAESFYKSFNMPICIARPFNTFGPRQSARAIIPSLISQLCSGKKEIEMGSVHPTRDFVFVKDTVNGFTEIAKSDKTLGQEINIATQSEISMGDLAQKLIELINPEAKIVTDEKRIRPSSSEVERLYGSNQKLKELTDWNQKYNLEDGLKITIDWFNDPLNLSKYKTNIYNV